MNTRRTCAAFVFAGFTLALSSTTVILPASATTGGDAPAETGENPVLVGASDIASCLALDGAEATAALLDAIPGTVFTAGDNSQDNGTPGQYSDCFAPTWGRHRDRIRPVPGNHDYRTSGALGYYGYFGAAAGAAGQGYYSYDLGSWHVVALNSNCHAIGGCEAGSPEEQWLRADLASTTKPCTAAYWHHPLFTSSSSPSSMQIQPLFQALYEYGAEVVVNGHNHVYERFAPQDPSGNLDHDYGIREFDVGTGGKSHYSFRPDAAPNSEVRNNDTFGVLKLTLKADGYDWAFIPVSEGGFTDSGSGTCHGTPVRIPEPTPSAEPTPEPTESAAPTPDPEPTESAALVRAPRATADRRPTRATPPGLDEDRPDASS